MYKRAIWGRRHEAKRDYWPKLIQIVKALEGLPIPESFKQSNIELRITRRLNFHDIKVVWDGKQVFDGYYLDGAYYTLGFIPGWSLQLMLLKYHVFNYARETRKQLNAQNLMKEAEKWGLPYSD